MLPEPWPYAAHSSDGTADRPDATGTHKNRVQGTARSHLAKIVVFICLLTAPAMLFPTMSPRSPGGHTLPVFLAQHVRFLAFEILRDSDHHEFQSILSGGGEASAFIQRGGHRISGTNRHALAIDGCRAFATDHVVNFRHVRLDGRPCTGAGRQNQVINVRPGGIKSA